MTIAVKVQPRARRPGLQGRTPTVDGGEMIRIGVAEPAEDGRANRAVCRCISSLLGIPDHAVSVLQGASSRMKLIRAEGEPGALSAILRHW